MAAFLPVAKIKGIFPAVLGCREDPPPPPVIFIPRFFHFFPELLPGLVMFIVALNVIRFKFKMYRAVFYYARWGVEGVVPLDCVCLLVLKITLFLARRVPLS